MVKIKSWAYAWQHAYVPTRGREGIEKGMSDEFINKKKALFNYVLLCSELTKAGKM